MTLTGSRKIALISATAVLLLAGLLLALHFSRDGDRSAREHLLQFVPADATTVIYADLDELRASPFLAELYAWAPHSIEDSEYAQFVHDTGFSYERDLQRRVLQQVFLRSLTENSSAAKSKPFLVVTENTLSKVSGKFSG